MSYRLLWSIIATLFAVTAAQAHGAEDRSLQLPIRLGFLPTISGPAPVGVAAMRETAASMTVEDKAQWCCAAVRKLGQHIFDESEPRKRFSRACLKDHVRCWFPLEAVVHSHLFNSE